MHYGGHSLWVAHSWGLQKEVRYLLDFETDIDITGPEESEMYKLSFKLKVMEGNVGLAEVFGEGRRGGSSGMLW